MIYWLTCIYGLVMGIGVGLEGFRMGNWNILFLELGKVDVVILLLMICFLTIVL